MPRVVRLLKRGWRFVKGDPEGAEREDFDDSAWLEVRVPHDWAIEGPFDRENDVIVNKVIEDGDTVEHERTGRTGGLPHVGVAWYRLALECPDGIDGKRIRVEFDGVMSHSAVYLNGRPVGSWPFGYASFAFDLTGVARSGANVLAVRVENKPDASRWYPGAGIFRHVRLVTTGPVGVAHWGTFVTTPDVDVEKRTAKVRVRTEVDCHDESAGAVEIETTILDPEGATVASDAASAECARGTTFDQELAVADARLWSPETPELYRAMTTVRVGGETVDECETVFGIRTMRFDAAEGFSINGRPMKFKGVCLHHDLGPLGSAVNPSAIRRQLGLLRDMGCNAIRTSHNPPAPELLDLADAMGFLVIDEAFDEWRSGKCANGYHTLFDEWAEKDLRAFIRRDRNHPCVMMWSIGNEIREQDEREGGEVARFLADICRDEDPTRPTTAGFDNFRGAIAHGLADAVDVPGWNYKPQHYARVHAEHPDWPSYGSETASCISSRGEYFFPVDEERGLKRESLQVNSYDLSSPPWANVPDAEFRAQEELPFIMGEFVWTGSDYLGEPTPYGEEWPSRSSYFGIIDLCGIPKDRYFLYKSFWSEAEVLHLLPHWTWPGREGETTPVHCYTSYPKAELFVNGVSQGVRFKDDKSLMGRYRLVWSGVRYEPGELKIVALDRDDKPLAERIVRTAGEPAALRLTPNRTRLAADCDDLAFVTVDVLDAEGNLCPRADSRCVFKLEGPGEIAGVGNGDATSVEPFCAGERRAFNGRCMVIVRTVDGEGGKIELSVSSEGLRGTTVELASE
jgi:beta-galactosidase